MPVRATDSKTIYAGQTLDLSGTGRTVVGIQPMTIMPTYKARRRAVDASENAHKTAIGTWVNDDTNPATLQGYVVADCEFVRCITGTIECIIEGV